MPNIKELEKPEIKKISQALLEAGFEVCLVGGCVRDILSNKEPKDWDIATNAKPEETQKIFSDSVYENSFGTVAVKTRSDDPKFKIIEITTYRSEGKYTDKRHPDEVKFTKTINEDLARRDFTINAIALKMDLDNPFELIDPFRGTQDIDKKIIRAVGNPDERFKEDALRLMRAIRFRAQLDFNIEKETEESIKKHASLLELVSKERIRDEFSKMLMTNKATEGIEKMQELGILKYVIPELVEGIGVSQNKHHIFTVFEHNLKSLGYAVAKNFILEIRLAALLHDVGKAKSKRGEGEDATFYGHQVIGARMAEKILDRLHFSKVIIKKVVLLIREHMFVYDPEAVTDAGARRLLRRVGKENIDDLFLLREADRIGSGVPKAQPYRLRHLKFRIEKVSKDPISAKMLQVDGTDIMRELNMKPSPRIGYILSVLLEEVLDDPSLNTKDYLINKIKQLNNLKDEQLAEMSKFAKKSADEAQTKTEEEIKKKYFV
ncbi:CCA tRNA nucleotidyltransferase [Patescibacteria group bacterium]|nr:CCA tRNA nucleotidyltransferase [Patescibacteria group bacterium]